MLKKEELKNIVVVVTRYFGGTLLGKGGLVRAYSQSARLGIERAEIVKNILHYDYQLVIDYSIVGKVQNEILSMNHIISDISYTQNALFNVYVRYDKRKNFKKNMINITNGQIDIKLMGEKYIPFSKGQAIM